jgi:arylsulfatase
MRTPLIAHWPAGLKNPGRISHEPGHLVDVMSTCVELAGTQYPTQYKGNRIRPTPGLSLVPILQGKERQAHQAIYCEHWHSASVRADNWKLVTLDYRKPANWQLFNLEADPSETHDLKTQEPKRAQALFEQFRTWATDVQVTPEPKGTR